MIDDLLDRLDKVRQTGEGKFMACCPVHGDRNPSMTLSEVIGADGYRKVLVYCFACQASAQDVTEAVGLPMSVLFEKPLDRGGDPTDIFGQLDRGGSSNPLDRGAPSMPLDRGGVGTGRGGVEAGTGRGGVPLDRGGVRLTRKQREEVELDRLVIAGAEQAERRGERLSYRDWQRVRLARSRLEALVDD